ncbi:SIS domain-containing protein [Candidatus Kaiserbacteria bacterium]|nr:SIS domain-containing protein [Candidatus Kaiserbacteria bacterium]
MAGKQVLFTAVFERHREVVEKSMQQTLPDVEHGGALLFAALKAKRKVLVCGNGGSAADSQHFAAELVGRFAKKRKALPAIALTVDSSALTAIANDWDFEYVFARQVEALGRVGDVLVALTTSGRSKNVLAAIRVARKKKMRVIVLTGEKGKALRASTDVCIVIPSGETARIQEMHELTFHAWCEFLERKFHT